jgi:hypothetical protein
LVKNKRLMANFRRRAAEARRLGDNTKDPQEKLDLREVERRWLQLARNHEAQTRPPSKPRKGKA